MMERATSNDVAKKAGVSQATVSRVINNYPHVRESTRAKVLQAIREMGFTPDQVARSLHMKRTGTIGLIVGDIANPFFSETVKVVIGEARRRGFDVLVADTDHSDRNLDDAIRMMIGKRVDGVLIGSAERFDENVRQLAMTRFPLVMYNTKLEQDVCHYVVLNNARGARIAVEHLFGLGHRRIACVTGRLTYSTLYDRLTGFREAAARLGMDVREDHIFEADMTLGGIEQFLERVRSEYDPPSAVFASSDQIAFLMMEAALRQGIRVPEELSIIGFDDISLSANPFISLTTVSQQHRTMASTALAKLAELIETGAERSARVRVQLEPELILRGTTGPAPAPK